jgi:putative ABC transport system ATP-binding protein
MSPAVIEASDLVRTYRLGDNVVRALDGVSLRIHAGELVAIRGPSGSGKSTLMNVLGCLERPDSGKYLLEGEDVSRLSADRLAEIRNRRIGFVFQTFNLLPRMTALENVELPLHYAARRDARERAMEALRIVGLADRMEHEPNQLSGGQRQRVAIARAIVSDPAILLCDEPTGALDSRTGEEILALFKSINERGHTVIIVTHDLNVARHCQREIYLKDGRIVDPPERVAASEAPAEVAAP